MHYIRTGGKIIREPAKLRGRRSGVGPHWLLSIWVIHLQVEVVNPDGRRRGGSWPTCLGLNLFCGHVLAGLSCSTSSVHLFLQVWRKGVVGLFGCGHSRCVACPMREDRDSDAKRDVPFMSAYPKPMTEFRREQLACNARERVGLTCCAVHDHPHDWEPPGHGDREQSLEIRLTTLRFDLVLHVPPRRPVLRSKTHTHFKECYSIPSS